MAEAVVVMSEKSFGVAVVAEDGIIKGVISDGDMRRNVSRLWHSTAYDIATPLPVLIRKDWLAADAVGRMTRSDESRAGKECVSTFRSRWSPYHYKKTKIKTKRTR